MELKVKRVYEAPEASDGYRVLVDRLWPRGLSKEKADVDLWAKDVGPTPELRKRWHEATPDQFPQVVKAYEAELAGETAPALHTLADELRGKPTVTLLYGLHDTEHNHAQILAEALGPLLAS